MFICYFITFTLSLNVMKALMRFITEYFTPRYLHKGFQNLQLFHGLELLNPSNGVLPWCRSGGTLVTVAWSPTTTPRGTQARPTRGVELARGERRVESGVGPHTPRPLQQVSSRRVEECRLYVGNSLYSSRPSGAVPLMRCTITAGREGCRYSDAPLSLPSVAVGERRSPRPGLPKGAERFAIRYRLKSGGPFWLPWPLLSGLGGRGHYWRSRMSPWIDWTLHSFYYMGVQ